MVSGDRLLIGLFVGALFVLPIFIEEFIMDLLYDKLTDFIDKEDKKGNIAYLVDGSEFPKKDKED